MKQLKQKLLFVRLEIIGYQITAAPHPYPTPNSFGAGASVSIIERIAV